MRKIMLIFGILLLSIFLVLANGDHKSGIEESKKLVESGISCDKLTENQLEAMGDYYMEQMHPGEAHELMDEMMGGEGSESLRQIHIAMAKRLYCNDISGMTDYGMMGMMGGGMMNMMMGGNMMGSGGTNMMGTNLGYEMISSGYGLGYWGFLNVLSLILLIGLVILVYLWVIKLWRDIKNKSHKK